MNRRTLRRIVNICTIIIIVGVILLDHLDATYRVLAEASIVGATLTMIISCFRYDFARMGKAKNNEMH